MHTIRGMRGIARLILTGGFLVLAIASVISIASHTAPFAFMEGRPWKVISQAEFGDREEWGYVVTGSWSDIEREAVAELGRQGFRDPDVPSCLVIPGRILNLGHSSKMILWPSRGTESTPDGSCEVLVVMDKDFHPRSPLERKATWFIWALALLAGLGLASTPKHIRQRETAVRGTYDAPQGDAG
jgi:hypothetical protein